MNNEECIPDRLYHYTDQKGLLGILENRTIWATDIFYQNDSSEFVYGKNIFYERIKVSLKEKYKKIPPNFLELVEKAIEYFDNPVFTISFSEERISLNQYRSYSSSIPGFSIGMIPTELMRSLSTSTQHKLRRVLYNKDEQIAYADKVLNDTIREYRQSEIIDDGLIDFIAARIISSAPIIKHPAFYEEKEWRLIFDYLNPIRSIYKFRSGSSYIIPYLDIPFDIPKSIREIVIGPTPNPILAIKSVKDYIANRKDLGENIDIITSYCDIPFRKW